MDNSVNIIYLVIGLLVILIATIIFVWVLFDWAKLKKKISGIEYRREHGLFDEEQYSKGIASLTVNRKQTNKGMSPESYGKKISFIDHFDVLKK